MKYRVQRNRRVPSGESVWLEGQVVDLDEAEAAEVEAMTPGVLVPAVPEPEILAQLPQADVVVVIDPSDGISAEEASAAGRALAEYEGIPDGDRMQRKRRRRDRKGDPSDQGPIDSAAFKAVKDKKT